MKEKNPTITTGGQNQQKQLQFCFFCNKKAQFKCGLCVEATYCSAQHQKADWPSHKRRCMRPEDKLKQLYKHLQTYKKLFFEKLSKKLTAQCQGICDNILKISEEIMLKFPSPKHQIQYGTAICCYVKMLLAVKSFNEAQQILNNYLKQKDQFLRDTESIPSKLNPEDPKFSTIIAFVEGKLKLLSVLSNLTHQAVRNSVYMIQILVRHCEKFYGPDSLQVSNAYFELGNYYYFLNQSMKACACYLLAGDIRKQKGIISYYNAAIILIRNQSYSKALKFLKLCLQMISNNGDEKQIIDRIYLALALCYKKINHFDNTVHYLQKSLCKINNKSRFDYKEQNIIRQLLKILSENYRKQFNNDQILSLPRQKPKVQHQIVITNANFQDYWDLNVDNTKKKKLDAWMKSFKNQTQKTKFQSKVPMTNPLVEKVLFANHFTDDKNDQNTGSSVKTNNPTQYINVDLQFMGCLSSTQVKFMNELNRLLLVMKDKQALYDAVQNSNLMQQLSKQKIQRFYQLNPELIRQNQNYGLMEEDEFEPQMKGGNAPNQQRIKATKPKFDKLDLTKIKKNN